MRSTGDMTLGDATLRFVDQPHGGITSLGIRIDEGGAVARFMRSISMT